MKPPIPTDLVSYAREKANDIVEQTWAMSEGMTAAVFNAALLEFGDKCLEAAKDTAVVTHCVRTRGACCWNRPATCDIEVKAQLDTLRSGLRVGREG